MVARGRIELPTLRFSVFFLHLFIGFQYTSSQSILVELLSKFSEFRHSCAFTGYRGVSSILLPRCYPGAVHGVGRRCCHAQP